MTDSPITGVAIMWKTTPSPILHLPPPGMVRNSGPHFDQALDQPVHGAFHFFPVGE